jgi:hypothetical protein
MEYLRKGDSEPNSIATGICRKSRDQRILHLDDGGKHDLSNDRYAYLYDDVMGLDQKF